MRSSPCFCTTGSETPKPSMRVRTILSARSIASLLVGGDRPWSRPPRARGTYRPGGRAPGVAGRGDWCRRGERRRRGDNASLRRAGTTTRSTRGTSPPMMRMRHFRGIRLRVEGWCAEPLTLTGSYACVNAAACGVRVAAELGRRARRRTRTSSCREAVRRTRRSPIRHRSRQSRRTGGPRASDRTRRTSDVHRGSSSRRTKPRALCARTAYTPSGGRSLRADRAARRLSVGSRDRGRAASPDDDAAKAIVASQRRPRLREVAVRHSGADRARRDRHAARVERRRHDVDVEPDFAPESPRGSEVAARGRGRIRDRSRSEARRIRNRVRAESPRTIRPSRRRAQRVNGSDRDEERSAIDERVELSRPGVKQHRRGRRVDDLERVRPKRDEQSLARRLGGVLVESTRGRRGGPRCTPSNVPTVTTAPSSICGKPAVSSPALTTRAISPGIGEHGLGEARRRRRSATATSAP